MRIIGGKHKGRRFTAPQNIPTRPTTDFSKEALFNILNNNFYFDAISYLDLFAGTGSHSYEYASRGCTDITAVDMNKKCVGFIRKTSDELDFNIHVTEADVFSYIKTCKRKFNIIFAGPPYPLDEKIKEIPQLIFENDLLEDNGWLIVEHYYKLDLDDLPYFVEKRKYGQTVFSIFIKK